jgi:hypothetical protein
MKTLRCLLPPAAIGVLALAGCETSRDRPTGLGQPLPTTYVAVVAPPKETAVAVDSTHTVVVEASGLITAVEFFLARANSSDTLALGRTEFSEPEEIVQVDFEVKIPWFETGTHLQFRGIAEDLIGQRHVSEPVVVMVIECDIFPLACSDI